MARNTSLLWNYFDKDRAKKQATCRLCHNAYSYLSTTGNLKIHLKRKHPDVFERTNWNRSVEISDNEDDVCEELLKVADVWSYFDTDSGKSAKCNVCHTSVGNEYDELKAHLKDNHPKLLLQLLQNKDQESDAGSGSVVDEDNENTYTEIVYLEQEPREDVPKIKAKPKTFPKPAQKREPLQSRHSFDDIPIKKQKQEEKNDELSSFVQYITCLLKKLPADVFSNVQIEIINTILKAKSQAANTSRSMELPNTSSNFITVDGTVPLSTSTSGNYTITVTPSKELNTTESTENCN